MIRFVVWLVSIATTLAPCLAESWPIEQLQPGTYAGFWGMHNISALYHVTQVGGRDVSGTVEITVDQVPGLFDSRPAPFGFKLSRDAATNQWNPQWQDPPRRGMSERLTTHHTIYGPLLAASHRFQDGRFSDYAIVGFWTDTQAAPTNPFELHPKRIEVTGQIRANTSYHTAADGLAHNAGRSAVLTSDGYLWVGTISGLSRFDGLNWLTFTKETSGLPDNNVTALAEDHEERLIIGTKSTGLCYYADGQFSESWSRSGFEGRRIGGLYVTDDDSLWIDWGDCLGRLDSQGGFRSWTVADLHLPGTPTGESGDTGWGPKEKVGNRMLFGTSRGVCLLDPETGGQAVLGRYSLMMHRAGPDKFIHGSSGTFTITTNSLRHHQTFLFPGHIDGIRKMLPSRAGGYWIVTGNSLLFFDESADKLFSVADFPQRFCISADSLLEDSQGALWIVSNQYGLARVERQFISHLPSSGTKEWQPQTIVAEAEGSVVVAANASIERISGVSPSEIEKRSGDHYYHYIGVASSKDQPVWVALAPRPLGRFPSAQHPLARLSGTSISTEGLPTMEERIYNWSGVALRKNGEVWLGCEAGAFCYGGQTIENWNDTVGLERFHVSVILEDVEERLWIGTNGHGLYRVSQSATHTNYTEAKHGLPSDTILALFQDSKDTLWLGLSPGLCFWDESTGCFHTLRHGVLADLQIGAIVEDSQERLWIGSPHGIFVVTIEDLHLAIETGSDVPLRAITREDGLENETVYANQFPVACRSSDGMLYFCMEGGVARIDPRGVATGQKGPPIRIRAAITSNEERLIWGDPIPATIRFPANAQNLLRLDYGAICLTRPDKLRYQYRLLGRFPEWTDVGTERRAWYPQLPPGEYTFEVKATDYRQAISPEAATLAFTIAKHPHQTWWFRVSLATILLGLLGGGLALWMRSRSQMLALQKDLEMESERTRIARDMHDEIGTSLAQISLLGQLAEKGQSIGEKGAEKISALAKECSQSLREIIWSLDPQNQYFDDLEHYLRQQVARYLEGSGIHPQFCFCNESSAATFSPSQQRQLILILKGILSNVLLHSKATEFELKVVVKNGQFSLEAKDNGVGFDPDNIPPDTLGLTAIRERAVQLGGEFRVRAAPGQGTGLKLIL